VAWLEAANVIISAARKANGENWLTSDPVLDVVNALTKIGDAGKKLKAIRKRQKGEPADTADEGETATAPVLTAGRAVEFILAAIKTADKMSQSEAADLFADCHKIMDAWNESQVPRADLFRWTNNINNGVAVNMVVITEESKPETPEAEKSDIAALVAA
jgi:hypothetical protein